MRALKSLMTSGQLLVGEQRDMGRKSVLPWSTMELEHVGFFPARALPGVPYIWALLPPISSFGLFDHVL